MAAANECCCTLERLVSFVGKAKLPPFFRTVDADGAACEACAGLPTTVKGMAAGFCHAVCEVNCEGSIICSEWRLRGGAGGDGTSPRKLPYLISVRANTAAASSGSSTFHFRASTLRIASVLLAHSHPSAISSKCLTPCTISRLAHLSGKLSKWMVQAE